MQLKTLLHLCYGYKTNVDKITIIAESPEVKKLISNASKPGDMLLSAITIPIQEAYNDEKLNQFEVIKISIEEIDTLGVTLA